MAKHDLLQVLGRRAVNVCGVVALSVVAGVGSVVVLGYSWGCGGSWVLLTTAMSGMCP